MDIFVSKGEHDHEVCIRLPAAPDMIWPMLTELDRCSVSGGPARITGTSLFLNLAQYISGADLEEEADIRRLNVLAGMVDGMSVKDQQLLSGALDAESVNGLDDVLRVVYSLGQYEFIEGVTTDKELGGWLVEHGKAEVEFPKEVWPYLDYAGIGRSYYADHGGAYTPSGYVKRRDQICDAILDEFIHVDNSANVTVECMGTNDTLIIGGEVSSDKTIDIERTALNIYSNIG